MVWEEVGKASSNMLNPLKKDEKGVLHMLYIVRISQMLVILGAFQLNLLLGMRLLITDTE